MLYSSTTRRIFSQVHKTRFFSTTMSAQKQFVVVLKDFKDPECLQRRLDAREQHLKGALEANSKGVVNLGGAIFDDHENKRMEGSVLVITAESKQEIESMILDDPYYKGKVWEKWEILPVNLAIGKIADYQ